MTDDARDRATKIVFVLIVVFLPAFFLAFTLTLLQFFDAVVFTALSPVELVELYVLELVLFALFAYALYRLATRFRPLVDPSVSDTDSSGTDTAAPHDDE